MKKYYNYLVFLLVIFGIASAFIYFGRKVSKDLSHSPQITQEQKTVLTIGDQTFDISSFAGKSALDATQANAKTEMSGTRQNAFVTSINGKVADSKKHEFWELVINGVSAQVGAGSYIIQKGDSILWKISTY
jgi:hypothetical protein